MKTLGRFSFGMGDRFGHQGPAQLDAIIAAESKGIDITPVWNKSHREHSIIGTSPADVRTEADNAVKQKNWEKPYFVDADHISLDNVDLFIDSSDFFTLDVAEEIGKSASTEDIEVFLKLAGQYKGSLEIPGIDQPFSITDDQLKQIASKYLTAVKQAGKIYRHIADKKGKGNFITEVSMDETDQPQTPVELLFILLMIAEEKIPASTIAPKFTGRFNKGVDYVGDIKAFTKEFYEDVKVIEFAVKNLDLPPDLKLSIHSGSDKFSIYKPIKEIIEKTSAGLHIKTAGTTWLEEIIGLASADDPALEIAKKVYAKAYQKFDELCAPYATVIDIDRQKLPDPEKFNILNSPTVKQMITHDPFNQLYDPNVRQLLHVGYKIAAQMGDEYTGALQKYESEIAKHVTENILNRHIDKLF
jgi:hypothetical protein